MHMAALEDGFFLYSLPIEIFVHVTCISLLFFSFSIVCLFSQQQTCSVCSTHPTPCSWTSLPDFLLGLPVIQSVLGYWMTIGRGLVAIRLPMFGVHFEFVIGHGRRLTSHHTGSCAIGGRLDGKWTLPNRRTLAIWWLTDGRMADTSPLYWVLSVLDLTAIHQRSQQLEETRSFHIIYGAAPVIKRKACTFTGIGKDVIISLRL